MFQLTHEANKIAGLSTLESFKACQSTILTRVITEVYRSSRQLR